TSSIGDLLGMTYEHIGMVFLGIGLALVVGLPLGVLCTKNKTFETIIITLANLIQVIPSLALLAILMLIFGLGFNTVVIGLFLYFIFAGVRIAMVIAVSVATLAPFVGGEGLGREIVAGINVRDADKIFSVAIFTAALAILIDYLLGLLQKKLEVNR